jgi:hypothetical protein
MDRYKQWAAEINGSWDQAVPAFIKTGVKLKEAKDDLGTVTFERRFLVQGAKEKCSALVRAWRSC